MVSSVSNRVIADIQSSSLEQASSGVPAGVAEATTGMPGRHNSKSVAFVT
jgi:hypothetical protein